MLARILLSLVLLISLKAQASSTVCSNEVLYYSYVSDDFIISPPTGTKTGSLFIVYNSAVLVREIFFANRKPNRIAVRMDLTGTPELIAQTGDARQGTTIFHQVATLVSVNRDGTKGKELFRSPVICVTKVDRKF